MATHRPLTNRISNTVDFGYVQVRSFSTEDKTTRVKPYHLSLHHRKLLPGRRSTCPFDLIVTFLYYKENFLRSSLPFGYTTSSTKPLRSDPTSVKESRPSLSATRKQPPVRKERNFRSVRKYRHEVFTESSLLLWLCNVEKT